MHSKPAAGRAPAARRTYTVPPGPPAHGEDGGWPCLAVFRRAGDLSRAAIRTLRNSRKVRRLAGEAMTCLAR